MTIVDPAPLGALEQICIVCGKRHVPEILQDPANVAKWEAESADKHIQDIFPDCTAMQREQILTGICSEKCREEATEEDNWEDDDDFDDEDSDEEDDQ
jgi:hypothetical protein